MFAPSRVNLAAGSAKVKPLRSTPCHRDIHRPESGLDSQSPQQLVCIDYERAAARNTVRGSPFRIVRFQSPFGKADTCQADRQR
jgi:hypothetical protein